MEYFRVSAHDQRDFDFATKYNLDIIRVVSAGKDQDKNKLKEAYTGNGKIINSDFLNDLEVGAAKEKIIGEIESRNLGKEKPYLDLKDWGIKTTLLGLPIPMILKMVKLFL